MRGHGIQASWIFIETEGCLIKLTRSQELVFALTHTNPYQPR
jgi:hypothetical protein